MAVNPLHFLKLKDRYHIFREEHPKFIPYLKMLGEKAAEEGTILEVKAITKDGKEYVSNIRLTANDIETLKMFTKKDSNNTAETGDHTSAL